MEGLVFEFQSPLCSHLFRNDSVPASPRRQSQKAASIAFENRFPQQVAPQSLLPVIKSECRNQSITQDGCDRQQNLPIDRITPAVTALVPMISKNREPAEEAEPVLVPTQMKINTKFPISHDAGIAAKFTKRLMSIWIFVGR